MKIIFFLVLITLLISCQSNTLKNTPDEYQLLLQDHEQYNSYSRQHHSLTTIQTSHMFKMDQSLLCVTQNSRCIVTKSTLKANCRCPDDFIPNKNNQIVYFGTDRNILPNKGNNERFGDKRGVFRYGYSIISIPTNHTKGEIERPWANLPF